MNTSRKLSVVTVFISSPSDVKDARDKLDKIIEKLNRTIAHSRQLYLKPFRWDHDVLPVIGTSPQEVIDRQVGHYDIYIGIMWKRFGTPTGRADSGTEYEFLDAFSRLRQSGAPHIMFYFCKKPFYTEDENEIAQFQAVNAFRRKVESLGIITTYVELDEFAASVEEHLVRLILQTGTQADQFADPPVPEATIDVTPPRAEAPRPAPASLARGSERVRELNPLEKISGRSIHFGLSEKDIDYIYHHQLKEHFGQELTRKERDELRKGLRERFPRKPVTQVKPFLLSRYLVTNEQFELFVKATNYVTSAERDKADDSWRTAFEASGPDHPVTHVSFKDAEKFCEWAGVRLPAQGEFERAVRGLSDTLFPWGSEWLLDHCNDLFYVGVQKTSPVNTFQEYTSSDGIYDLCGNVFEWVTASGLRAGLQLVVGGAYNCCAACFGHAAYYQQEQIHTYAPTLGFRFASNIA